MKVIMGVKMTELKDILSLSGNRIPLCNHLKMLYEAQGSILLDNIPNKSKVVIDTSNGHGDDTRLNMIKSYKFVFVPLDVAEEALFATASINTMEIIKEALVHNNAQVFRADEIINRYENQLSTICDKYSDIHIIRTSNCVLFIFEDNKIEDVVLAHLPIIEHNILNKSTEYHCATCNTVEVMDNKTLDTFLPNMRYKVDKNKVLYFCDDCVSRNTELQKLKHVGE